MLGYVRERRTSHLKRMHSTKMGTFAYSRIKFLGLKVAKIGIF